MTDSLARQAEEMYCLPSYATVCFTHVSVQSLRIAELTTTRLNCFLACTASPRSYRVWNTLLARRLMLCPKEFPGSLARSWSERRSCLPARSDKITNNPTLSPVSVIVPGTRMRRTRSLYRLYTGAESPRVDSEKKGLELSVLVRVPTGLRFSLPRTRTVSRCVDSLSMSPTGAMRSPPP